MVADTSLVLGQALDRGETVLFEAGQATLLDVDHGTYPYVTSSNAVSAGACTGSGVPPTRIDSVIAILKAYTTRVGEGPFPTELHDDSGEFLRKTGAEYGTTTGRPRRCGWIDAVVGRYATRINGVTDFVITKLDVLTGLDTVPVCVAYDVGGVRHDEMPVNQTDFHHATPIYEELPGWWEDITALPLVRGAARQRPGLRAACRGAHRRPGVGDRRRTGSRRDHRAPPAQAGGGRLTSLSGIPRSSESAWSRRTVMTDNVVEQKVELDWVTRLADEVDRRGASAAGRTARSSARRASARRGRSTWATSAS